MIFRWVGEGPIESRGVAEKSQSRMRPFAKVAGSIARVAWRTKESFLKCRDCYVYINGW
jgi:hypothetical protein